MTINKVKLYGNVLNLFGIPLENVRVIFRISPSPQTIGENIIDRANYEVLTDELGYFEKEVLGGLKVTVIIPSTKFTATGVLPVNTRTLKVTELELLPSRV